MPTKTMSLEIAKFCAGDRKRRAAWKDLSEQVQIYTNRIWQVWEHWHLENGTRDKLGKWLAAAKAWHEADRKTRGKKPPFPCEPVSKQLSKRLWKVSDEFPTLHARTKTLTLNAIVKLIKSRKAANGSLPGWISIIMCREAKPSFTYPLPIRFDRQAKAPQAVLIPPEKSKDNWKLRIRVERMQEKGKRADSLQEDCELLTKRHKTGHIVRTLEKIQTDPKYKLLGSQLSYRKGKWFALLTYSWETESADVDTSKRAVLMPGRRDPWVLLAGGRLGFAGGHGKHVAPMRRAVSIERRDRQDQYKWAGSASKGHGRKRATAPWRKLETRWREYVKRYNHRVTTEVVRLCVERGIGTLEYWQPKDERRDDRFLVREGNDGSLRGVRSAWDFFQVKTMLAGKCDAAGIDFVERSFGVKPKRERGSGKRVA